MTSKLFMKKETTYYGKMFNEVYESYSITLYECADGKTHLASHGNLVVEETTARKAGNKLVKMLHENKVKADFDDSELQKQGA